MLRERRDVALVTIPLLRAPWYRDELARRERLWPLGAAWAGEKAALTLVANEATRTGRPVAVAVTVAADDRAMLGSHWELRGLAYAALPAGEIALTLDTTAVRRAAAKVAAWGGVPAASPRANVILRYLECPETALRSWGREPLDTLLDSRCNLR